jgi:hypothetical protein
MASALSFLCRQHRIIPRQVRISVSASEGTSPVIHLLGAQLPYADIFRCVAEGGRVVQLELPRAKSDAQDSKIEVSTRVYLCSLLSLTIHSAAHPLHHPSIQLPG